MESNAISANGGSLSEILLVTLIVGVANGSVYISNKAMSKMVELMTTVPFCAIRTDRDKIQNTIFGADPMKVRQVSDEALSQLEHICITSEIESTFQGGFTYPGTKWCGPGATSKNYSDLGFNRQEDMCCRAHDNCPNYLMAGECRGDICNKSPYTRSHCDCDETFKKCLQKVNTETANTIGAIFFNVVQVICFREQDACAHWKRLEDVISDESSTTMIVPIPVVNDCPIEYLNSGRYIVTYPNVRRRYRNTKEFVVNKVFRFLGVL